MSPDVGMRHFDARLRPDQLEWLISSGNPWQAMREAVDLAMQMQEVKEEAKAVSA